MVSPTEMLAKLRVASGALAESLADNALHQVSVSAAFDLSLAVLHHTLNAHYVWSDLKGYRKTSVATLLGIVFTIASDLKVFSRVIEDV